MSDDFPDSILIAKCHPFRGDNFYVSLGHSKNAVEYVRKGAALEPAPPQDVCPVKHAYMATPECPKCGAFQGGDE